MSDDGVPAKGVEPLTRKPAIFLWALVAVGSLLAIGLYLHGAHEDSGDLAVETGPSRTSDVATSPQSRESAPVKRPARTADSIDPSNKEDFPEGARGEEDAAWMVRHGYPTHAELIETEAEGPLSGSLVPSTPRETAGVALSLLDSATQEDAEASLNDAAMLGDVYALYAMGLYFEPVSAIKSQGYFRAAIMRGDWMISTRPKPRLDTFQDALATMFALRLLEDFDAERRRRGLPPLRRELRPGMDEFMVTLSVLEEEYGEP